MAQQLINIGTVAGDGTGDPGRVAFDKANDNFTDLYATRAQVKHTAIRTATRVITDAELVLGMNMFGVSYPGDVSILLPVNIDSNKLIIINDESGLAGTNNITITVVSPITN